jgi:uncharacterized membrane protein YfcA
MYFTEVIQFIICILSSAIACACGIGGNLIKNIFIIIIIIILLLFYYYFLIYITKIKKNKKYLNISIITLGGFIFSSVFIYVEEFTAQEAFPLAMVLILISSTVTYISGVKNKYENPDVDFVDYDFSVVYIPTMLLGTKIGTIMNKMFSSFLLIMLIIVIIFISFQKTWKR